MPLKDQYTSPDTVRNDGDRGYPRSVLLILIGVLVAAGSGWFMWSRQADTLDRAQGALELQVLASRLGVSAIEAEYGNYEEASRVASSVFDGVVNYGIEHGALPENYARVLRARDEVIVGLASGAPEARERLVELFFLLQLPASTELDSRYIVPATDSGRGLPPPVRHTDPEPDSSATQGGQGVPDSSSAIGARRDSVPAASRGE